MNRTLGLPESIQETCDFEIKGRAFETSTAWFTALVCHCW